MAARAGASGAQPGGPGSTAEGRRSRDRVLQASLDLITDVGIDQIRLAEIARRAGMSSGQVMYYFSSKEHILLETLAWRERTETTQRQIEMPEASPGWPRLRLFVDLYLPTDLNDPVWIMWMEAWARAPHSKEVTDFLDELMLPWRDDLAEIVEQGISVGSFERPRSAEGFSTRFCALLDGLAIFRLRQNPELLSSELVEMAMLTARAELGRSAVTSSGWPGRGRGPAPGAGIGARPESRSS
jgi:AcrR family transcriptional regulator